MTQGGQTCHSIETLLTSSEPEKTSCKEKKDVFFSAGQNTTFLAGTSRTVCPLWQYPALLDVHKCVCTCNPVWLHNLPPRAFGKKDIWEASEIESSLQHAASLAVSSIIWTSWWLGKQPKKTTLTVDQVPRMLFWRCITLQVQPQPPTCTYQPLSNSWVHDQNNEPAPGLHLFLLFAFPRMLWTFGKCIW